MSLVPRLLLLPRKDTISVPRKEPAPSLDRDPLINQRNPMYYFPPGTHSLDKPTSDHETEDGEQCRLGD